jgi:hypothetical protein
MTAVQRLFRTTYAGHAGVRRSARFARHMNNVAALTGLLLPRSVQCSVNDRGDRVSSWCGVLSNAIDWTALCDVTSSCAHLGIGMCTGHLTLLTRW